MVANGPDSSRANGVYVSASNVNDEQFKQRLVTNVKSLSYVYVSAKGLDGEQSNIPGRCMIIDIYLNNFCYLVIVANFRNLSGEKHAIEWTMGATYKTGTNSIGFSLMHKLPCGGF
jgi:transcriptional antiterminator